VSFVEESGDHRLFIAAALHGGRRDPARPPEGVPADLRAVRRAPVLRRRRRVRAAPSRLGVGVGIAMCEDFWHLQTPQLLALDGAQLLINVSSSPGRDPRGPQRGWAGDRDLLAYVDAHVCPAHRLVRGGFVNRVGVDESMTFWGGSGGHRAGRGEPIFSAPFFDDELTWST
jgi:hypothetical protein